MRFFVLSITLVFVTTVSWSQHLDSVRFEYCEVVTIDAELVNSAVYVEIDFGDQKNIKKLKDPDTGKARIFRSPIDALNFLGREGWELVTTQHQEAYPRNRYLLKRKVRVAGTK